MERRNCLRNWTVEKMRLYYFIIFFSTYFIAFSKSFYFSLPNINFFRHDMSFIAFIPVWLVPSFCGILLHFIRPFLYSSHLGHIFQVMLNADGKYFRLMFHKSCLLFVFFSCETFHGKRRLAERPTLDNRWRLGRYPDPGCCFQATCSQSSWVVLEMLSFYAKCMVGKKSYQRRHRDHGNFIDCWPEKGLAVPPFFGCLLVLYVVACTSFRYRCRTRGTIDLLEAKIVSWECCRLIPIHPKSWVVILA